MGNQVTLEVLKEDLASVKEDINILKEYVGIKQTNESLQESKAFFFAMHKCKTKDIYVRLYQVALLNLRLANQVKFCFATGKILENLLFRSLPLAISPHDVKSNVYWRGKNRPAYLWIFDVDFLKSRSNYNPNQLSQYQHLHSLIENNKPFLFEKMPVNDLFKLLLYKFIYHKEKVIGPEFYVLQKIWAMRNDEAHITEETNTIDLVKAKELSDRVITSLLPFMNEWIKANPEKKQVFR